MEKYSMQEQGLLICANILMAVGIISGVVLYFVVGGIYGIIAAAISIIVSITIKCFLAVIVEISKNIKEKTNKG